MVLMMRRVVEEEEVEEKACLDLCSLVVFEEQVSFDNLPFYLIPPDLLEKIISLFIYLFIFEAIDRNLEMERET